MNISYNWLKDYLQFDLSPRNTAHHIHRLETGNVEEIKPSEAEWKVWLSEKFNVRQTPKLRS